MKLTSAVLTAISIFWANSAMAQNNNSDELIFSAPPAARAELPHFNSIELQYFWSYHNLKAYAPANKQQAVYQYFDSNNNGVIEPSEEKEMLAHFSQIKTACKTLQRQAQPLPGENQAIGLHVY